MIIIDFKSILIQIFANKWQKNQQHIDDNDAWWTGNKSD